MEFERKSLLIGGRGDMRASAPGPPPDERALASRILDPLTGLFDFGDRDHGDIPENVEYISLDVENIQGAFQSYNKKFDFDTFKKKRESSQPANKSSEHPPSDNYIVSTTNRGKPCILMNGYKYLCHILNKRCPNKYWQCDRYSGKQPCCKVRAVMREDGKFCPNGYHSHPPNPSLIRLQEKICFQNKSF